MKYFILVENAMIATELLEILRKEKIKATLAPTPRQASHACGVSVYLYNKEDLEKIEPLAKENKIKIDEIFESNLDFNTKRNKFL
ncbi:hypothetical protein HMPREF3045_05685 [Anaerococcus sp. HMSC075B03]|uniref:DUF3343 domain-containing protein n=1 Tax=Anaerococcus TaxID=165779 RepID=UPI0008A11520|nr:MULTISPECIES: DUF3343 domain-containing protein [Anaerococcus]MDU2649043.1 DUF3343 domain-containing protein [Anaerococcus vaginalis]MDU5086009.1 DUF3343 domain-containing protein [Anaerococcus vaginalis]MDU5341537.1 DUF3343 domain-containing protein [Anaerococcus vaginalis]OFL13989.1 hypothetical protein HMPREF2782_04135 [Anaerococcus sp. HMSC068A02]OFO40272.1 hypothetical protein HMPREF3045_05685 [Anaerococcus sp. HMSC075B03]